MSVQRKVKTGCVFMLAAAALLMVLLMGPEILKTWATGGNCSITVSLPINEPGGENSECLEVEDEAEVPVYVYRVADLDDAGRKFTAVEPFKDLDLAKLNQGTAVAADLEQLAKQADEIILSKDSVETTAEAMIVKRSGDKEATAVITGLAAGLYLVAPQSITISEEKSVTFTPYLIDLGLSSDGTGKPDNNVNVSLKPGVVPPTDIQDGLGKLKITKNLQDFNASLGKTTFVFQIVGVDVHGTTKYEEVASLDFDAPGNKTLTFDNIPAGLTVTVTEVYSGASYEVVGPKEQTVTIVSDEAVRSGNGEVASVSFTNRYNGKNRVGYGVENRFKSDGKGGWIWETSTKSASE